MDKKIVNEEIKDLGKRKREKIQRMKRRGATRFIELPIEYWIVLEGPETSANKNRGNGQEINVRTYFVILKLNNTGGSV